MNISEPFNFDSYEARPTPPKSEQQIAREWDRVASLRFEQQSSGVDLSFDYVFLPLVQELLGDKDISRILDVGCGTGTLTSYLSQHAGAIVGIDISRRSIDIAKQKYGRLKNASFEALSIQELADSDSQPFTAAVANMVMMTTPVLHNFIDAVRRILVPGGTFIWTVTHPWFWSRYWKYESATWFSYEKEIPIEATFRISLADSGIATTHFHRPLSMYMEELRRCRFYVLDVREPMPSAQQQESYPEPWQFPRFLACVAKRVEKN